MLPQRAIPLSIQPTFNTVIYRAGKLPLLTRTLASGSGSARLSGLNREGL